MNFQIRQDIIEDDDGSFRFVRTLLRTNIWHDTVRVRIWDTFLWNNLKGFRPSFIHALSSML